MRGGAGKFQRAILVCEDVYYLNEDLVEVNTEPGSVTVQGVSGESPPVIVQTRCKFETQFSLPQQEIPVLPVPWKPRTKISATINQDGSLQAVSPGNVGCT